MSAGHYSALLTAYSLTFLVMFGIARQARQTWPHRPAPTFARPWLEVAWSLAAVLAVSPSGCWYSRGLLLPATGRERPLLDAANQLLIYAPLPLLLFLRRQGPETAWLPTRGILPRVGVGFGLALLALAAYAFARSGLAVWPSLVAHVYDPRHVSYFVQVLLEDVSIAVLFVRFRSALGSRWPLILVAGLRQPTSRDCSRAGPPPRTCCPCSETSPSACSGWRFYSGCKTCGGSGRSTLRSI